MMSFISKRSAFLSCSILCFVLSSVCQGQSEISSSAIEKAKSFVGTRTTGRYVLEFVHMGATYQGHSINRVTAVQDTQGNLIPGEFAVIYDFVWDANGTGNTQLCFYCNRNGEVTAVRSLKCDAFVNTPFVFADGAIKVVGQIAIEAFGSQMTASDRQMVQSLVNSANSRGLLEFGLAMRQKLGIR